MKKFTLTTAVVIFFMLSSMHSFSQILSEDFSSGTFPPAGWTIIGDGQYNWSASESNLAGGEAQEALFNYSPAFVGISRLTTLTIPTAGTSQLLLKFKHFLDDYGPADSYTLSVETTTDGGATWNLVWSMANTGVDVGPEEISIIIDNADVGSDDFQIAFGFNGDSFQLDNWYIDDVELSQALNFDAIAVDINMLELIGSGDIITPKATVKNGGTETITFDANLTIAEQGSGTVAFNETVDVTDLAPNETMLLTFSDWTSITGDFDITLTTNLLGDENPENDTAVASLSAVEGLILLKPLYEEFTSATCGPCAAGNEILDPVLAANEGTHSVIKYQVDWPGDGDPYYTEECGVRKDYYGVDFAPWLNINAEYFDLFGMTQQVYDSYLPIGTALEIEIITAEIDENYNVTISLNIDVVSDYEAGLKAHIAVVEKKTVGNAMTNGETEFHNVMMKMLPDALGSELPALTVGVTETITQTYNMSLTHMEGPNDLAVVVFVQDDSDKSIIQSETADIAGEFDTYSVTFNVMDSDGNVVEGAEIFLESNGTLYTDDSGQSVYDGVFNGSFDYDVSAPGLLPASGTVEVLDANISVDVVLGVPEYYFYEDFAEEIPVDWTLYFEGWDFLYWFDGTVVFFRQSETLNPLMLVSPAIDVSEAGSIIFSLGEMSGDPELAFGTISDPTDPTTFNGLETYYPGIEWEDFEYDLAEFAGSTEDIYFSWKHNISETSFFSLNYVIITAGIIESVEKEMLKNVQIFPNPTSDKLNISLELSINQITVYNAVGQLIDQIRINNTDYQLNVSDYDPGIYMLQIETEKGRIIKSISVK